jgi:hypothetical protein
MKMYKLMEQREAETYADKFWSARNVARHAMAEALRREDFEEALRQSERMEALKRASHNVAHLWFQEM